MHLTLWLEAEAAYRLPAGAWGRLVANIWHLCIARHNCCGVNEAAEWHKQMQSRVRWQTSVTAIHNAWHSSMSSYTGLADYRLTQSRNGGVLS